MNTCAFLLTTLYTCRPVKDMNEVTFHGLETILVHLHNTKGQVSRWADTTQAHECCFLGVLCTGSKLVVLGGKAVLVIGTLEQPPLFSLKRFGNVM